MIKIPTYPKIYALGHRALEDLFHDDEIVVQEKIDGSNFSFMQSEGELYCRSKNAELPIDTTGGLFGPAVETAVDLWERGLLKEGWIYRGEAVCKPKHNTLTYDHAPKGGVILFDIERALESSIHPIDFEEATLALGLEHVPAFRLPDSPTEEDFLRLLEIDSCLGGTKIEGIVIKNPFRFGVDGKRLMGKYVSAKFKEVHAERWKRDNPGRKELVESIIDGIRTEARWEKAVQRLNELGIREHSPKDIGALVKIVPPDIQSECEDQIKEILFKHFWQQISRGSVRGLAAWYKEKLLKEQFEDEYTPIL